MSNSIGPNSFDPEIARQVKWQPRWEVNLGHDSKLGIAVDDHCFVVLYPTEDGGWQPGTHIPKSVAERIVRLTQEGVLGEHPPGCVCQLCLAA